MSPLKILLLTSTCVVLSGCFEERSGGEVESQDHASYVEKQVEKKPISPKPLNVRTLSGSYLVAQQAQANNDWKVSSKYLNQFLFEKPSISKTQSDALKQRAMIINLGAGKMRDALYYAKRIPKDNSNPLSTLLVMLPKIQNNEFNQVLSDLNELPDGGLSDLIKPNLKSWVIFAQGNTPKVPQNISSQELYHLILGADYAGKTEFLKKVLGAEFPTEGMSLKNLIVVADIMVRHGLTGRALSLYQDLKEDFPDQQGIVRKVQALEAGKDIPDDELFSKIETVQKGVALSLLDVGLFLFQEDSMDSAKLFAHISLYFDAQFEDAQLLLAYVSASYKKYDKAIAFFEKITQDDQERYIQAQKQIAILQEESGNRNQAIKTLDRLSKVDNTIELQIEIGDMARRAEDYKKALSSYNNVFSMYGDEQLGDQYWGVYYSRGIAYERLDQWDLAEKDLQKALSLEPNHPYVLNYLGYSWADQGRNLKEALNMITKAVNIRPNDGYIVDSLGWVYFKLGEYDQAVKHLKMAVSLMPEDPTLNDHLGDAYWKVGDKHKANLHWQRAKNFIDVDGENLSLDEKSELISSLESKFKQGL